MGSFSLRSISSQLALLIFLAVLPGIVILSYSGIEQRNRSIKSAKEDVALLVHSMAETQNQITLATRQILTMISVLPAVRQFDLDGCNAIFADILTQNHTYNNIALVDINGVVLASGKPFQDVNLADRKHFQEVLATRDFAVGEYIISRTGGPDPAFPFAYPVIGDDGELVAIVTVTIKLTSYSRFWDTINLPEKSFVAVTDYQGVRLFYYPAINPTNPVGAKINAANWQIAESSSAPGSFWGKGSDGLSRLFAFEQVRLSEGSAPYLYVWAAIPEDHIVQAADDALQRDLLLMTASVLAALLLSWKFGLFFVITPIKKIVDLTQEFVAGRLQGRADAVSRTEEFDQLISAFHDMAESLTANQRILEENQTRFRLLLDSLNALVYVVDVDSHTILFMNEYGQKKFGDVVGTVCWQRLQKGRSGPCDLCGNKFVIAKDGVSDLYCFEYHNELTGQWLSVTDRAIPWVDGRMVKLQIAIDISDRKQQELVQQALIEKLEKALEEIKTLQGILPICSHCKNIRNDQGYYEKIETYLHKHSGVDFSHTICPTCFEQHYPQEYQEFKRKVK
jgi:PAS domain-containing protein